MLLRRCILMVRIILSLRSPDIRIILLRRKIVRKNSLLAWVESERYTSSLVVMRPILLYRQHLLLQNFGVIDSWMILLSSILNMDLHLIRDTDRKVISKRFGNTVRRRSTEQHLSRTFCNPGWMEPLILDENV